MKLILILLATAGSALAQSQTSPGDIPRAARPATTSSAPAPRREHAVRSSETNAIRIVEGKRYPYLSASNWVTLPGPKERARYLRPSNYGPVFALEKRMEVRYRQSAGDGTRVWYEPFQEIAIRNYPERKLVVGALLPVVRVMPIRTTSEGIAVYDYGLPVPAGAKEKP